jgi:hypothetical protein
MKKILAILALILPLSLNAQILGEKHHLEAGLGVAVPNEMLIEQTGSESNTADIYASYRFDLTPKISLGAVYSFVPNHAGVIKSGDITVDTKSMYHTLNVFAEFKLGTFGPMNMYAGVGGGPQYRHASYSRMIGSSFSGDYFSGDVYAFVGMELFDHLRISIGHFHDLHYPISALPSGAPYYYVNVGWAF